jgi:hypothetical protein
MFSTTKNAISYISTWYTIQHLVSAYTAPGLVLSTISRFILMYKILCEVNIIQPILQLRMLRTRRVFSLGHSHTYETAQDRIQTQPQGPVFLKMWTSDHHIRTTWGVVKILPRHGARIVHKSWEQIKSHCTDCFISKEIMEVMRTETFLFSL